MCKVALRLKSLRTIVIGRQKCLHVGVYSWCLISDIYLAYRNVIGNILSVNMCKNRGTGTFLHAFVKLFFFNSVLLTMNILFQLIKSNTTKNKSSLLKTLHSYTYIQQILNACFVNWVYSGKKADRKLLSWALYFVARKGK